MRTFWLVAALSLVAGLGCATFGQIWPSNEPSASKRLTQGTVKGDWARAAGVAMSDFIAVRQAEVEAAIQTDGGSTSEDPMNALLRCFARPEAYEARIWNAPSAIVVHVVPVAERCLGPNASTHDGDVLYEIDPETFVVLGSTVSPSTAEVLDAGHAFAQSAPDASVQ